MGKKAAGILYDGAARSVIAQIELVKPKLNNPNLDAVLRYANSRYTGHAFKPKIGASLAR